MLLQDKRVIITGASSGIGEVVTANFLKEGAVVVGCGIEAEYSNAHENFIYKQADLTCYSQAEAVAEIAGERFSGELDILVNCAGITGVGIIDDTSVEEFKRQFDVNVFALYNMCKAAMELLKKGNGPNIVNIGSELGERVAAQRIAYGPAKAAVHMLTQCLAVDCAPHIRVNAVMPGLTETPMTKARFEQSEDPEAYRQFVIDRYPLKRICEPQDVAESVMFLASDKSRNITGELMAVCGGGHIFINN